jgi:hypothetical protein
MSDLMVEIAVTLLVMLAAGFGMLALGIRLVLRRTPRVTGMVAAICVLAAINTPNLRAERYSEKSHARIELAARQLAPALDRYRQAHGHYPRTLKEAGLEAPRTPYGRLYYFSPPPDMGIMYQWAYGNNEINGFEALWSSEDGKWKIHRF